MLDGKSCKNVPVSHGFEVYFGAISATAAGFGSSSLQP